MPSAADFPYLRATVQVKDKPNHKYHSFYQQNLYDVQFYPYTPPGVDPVFAVTGGQQTFVCRPVLEKDNSIEVLREFSDPDEDIIMNSLAWSQDIQSGDPLLCISGNPSSIIRILNVRTGTIVRSLSGHGAGVHDLVISPLSPAILASASEDHSIRIWNLDPAYAKQPCPVICSGEEGHQDQVLTIAFHRTGRYLLSGAMDSAVKLWVIPELPDEHTGTDKVNIIHYPHFSTTEIHSDMVDCVLFYGDLVLSRSAKEDQIVLWKIDGFNGNSPPPPRPTAGQKGAYGTSNPEESNDAYGTTSSAFGGRHQRLMTFDTPFTSLFYNRFSLFHMPNKRPMLVMGNERSRFMWWDLQRLEEEGDMDDNSTVSCTNSKRKRPDRDGHHREESVGSNASSGIHSTGTGTSAHSSNSALRKSNTKPNSISDPFTPIPCHKTNAVPRISFNTRRMAWSVGGEWAVAAGDHGTVCLFRRWD